MKVSISRSRLIKIIKEEKRRILNEGCGCGCNGAPGGCGGYGYEDEIIPLDDEAHIQSADLDYVHPEQGEIIIDDIGELEPDDAFGLGFSAGESGEFEDTHITDREFLSKGEAAKAVVAIAMSTSCPVTRETLLSAVDELM